MNNTPVYKTNASNFIEMYKELTKELSKEAKPSVLTIVNAKPLFEKIKEAAEKTPLYQKNTAIINEWVESVEKTAGENPVYRIAVGWEIIMKSFESIQKLMVDDSFKFFTYNLNTIILLIPQFVKWIDEHNKIVNDNQIFPN